MYLYKEPDKNAITTYLLLITSLEWLNLLTDILQILLTNKIYYWNMSRKSSHSEIENTCKRDAGKIERSSSLTSKNKNTFVLENTQTKTYFMEKTVLFPKVSGSEKTRKNQLGKTSNGRVIILWQMCLTARWEEMLPKRHFAIKTVFSDSDLSGEKIHVRQRLLHFRLLIGYDNILSWLYLFVRGTRKLEKFLIFLYIMSNILGTPIWMN